jgi:hypothetical protein
MDGCLGRLNGRRRLPEGLLGGRTLTFDPPDVEAEFLEYRSQDGWNRPLAHHPLVADDRRRLLERNGRRFERGDSRRRIHLVAIGRFFPSEPNSILDTISQIL